MRSIGLPFAVVLLAAASHARACDKVDYVEAKDWSTQKIQRAYCADIAENFARLQAKLNRIEDYSSRDFETCKQQIALYKRLLEARGNKDIRCGKN